MYRTVSTSNGDEGSLIVLKGKLASYTSSETQQGQSLRDDVLNKKLCGKITFFFQMCYHVGKTQEFASSLLCVC